MKQLKILASLAVCGIALSSCGKKGLSSNIDFDLLPQNPLVVSGDLTIGSGEDATVIKGPWFLNNYSFKNNNEDETLYVVTLKYSIVGNKDGTDTDTYETSIDPGKDCPSGTSRPYLAVVAPKDTFSGIEVDVTNGNCLQDGTDTYASITHLEPPSYESLYIDGLPKSDNYYYTINVEAIGWFQNSDNEITERLVSSKFLTTR